MQDIGRLYEVAAVREFDRRLIQGAGIPGFDLMRRAAAVCWRELQQRWPEVQRIVVLCGGGNNGGDGYEIACLARAAGCEVSVVDFATRAPAGDAARARQAWLEAGGECQRWTDGPPACIARADVLVDAIFGTGLSRPPAGVVAEAIAAINQRRAAGAGVLAVDVPSGLDADHGTALGACVAADVTVTFVGRKLGLHTGAAPDFTGSVVFDPLVGVETAVEAPPAVGRLLQADELQRLLPRRRRTAHKGSHGRVLIVGGDYGMAGAVLMAARAALRAGAGMVTVATRAEHARTLVAAQPEVMFRPVDKQEDLVPLLERADVVAIGPGLGQAAWGRKLWEAAAERPHLVVDADALNLLAQVPRRQGEWILTPHPGEAARLLGCSTHDIQADRLAAVRRLAERYGGYPVLKGAGTLVWQGTEVALCPFGNPGMGTGGMGDALTGIVAACLAQGLTPADAAVAGVLVHALAGDAAARTGGERGLLPTDLIDQLRQVVNPDG